MLIAVALATALVGVSTVILSIVLALFLALGLDPLVSRIERAGIARGWGIAIVFTAFAVVVALVIWLIVPRVIQQLVEFVQAVPAAMAALASQDWFVTAMDALGANPDAVAEGVAQFFSDPERLLALTGGVVATGFGVIGGISSTIVIVALTLYMLASIEGMKSAFYRFTPAYGRSTVIRLTETITGSMGGFVMTMAVLGALNATLVMLLHVVLRLPFPALMGVIAFFLTLIPVVGSVLFWVVGSVVALFTDPVAALIFAVLYIRPHAAPHGQVDRRPRHPGSHRGDGRRRSPGPSRGSGRSPGGGRDHPHRARSRLRTPRRPYRPTLRM